jgi:RNA recognition motif-containing protein
MAKKLYVGGVAYSTSQQGLQEAFAKFGTVISAQIMMDKMTGRSRGFGFVEMEDADAEAAINGMNGATLDGRKLVVNEAKPMVPRDQYKRPSPMGDRNDRQGY